ncbi:MAG: XRE family transcriptional regulator [Candidatus Diapherotrites archaeon]
MAVKFPCEMIGWIILPAIRKELVIYLVNEKNLPRKEVSEMLDLTPAALSQYLKGKRGKKIKLNKKEIKKIHEMGDELIKAKSGKKFASHSCEICTLIRKKGLNNCCG